MALIDKESVLHKIGQMPTAWEYGQAVKDIYEMIKNEPAADAAPVVYGKWERPHWRNSDYCCDCSACGKEAMHREYQWQKRGIYPICPNCGARMYQKEEKTDEVQK